MINQPEQERRENKKPRVSFSMGPQKLGTKQISAGIS